MSAGGENGPGRPKPPPAAANDVEPVDGSDTEPGGPSVSPDAGTSSEGISEDPEDPTPLAARVDDASARRTEGSGDRSATEAAAPPGLRAPPMAAGRAEAHGLPADAPEGQAGEEAAAPQTPAAGDEPAAWPARPEASGPERTAGAREASLGSAKVLRGHLSQAARVGQDYSASLGLPDGFEVEDVEGLEEAGLAFDRDAKRIHGVPGRPGSYAIRVYGHQRQMRTVVEVTLPVSPDPFSLWQDNPSDQEERFAKPDDHCTAIDGGLRLLTASRRGRKHAHVGAPRDDAAGVAWGADTGWHLAVVADGAGSAPLSRRGSHLAVERVLRDLPARLGPLDPGVPEDALRTALLEAMTAAAHDAATGIEADAKLHGERAEDYATTLAIGAARRVPEGWLVASFTIGDGLIALWSAEGPSVEVMIAADSGEYAGQTRFLSSAVLEGDCSGRLFVARPASFTAFALMTDGVSDARFPTRSAERDPAHWAAVWEEIAPLLSDDAPAERLLEWLDFRVPGEHDDRSLALMLPRGDP